MSERGFPDCLPFLSILDLVGRLYVEQDCVVRVVTHDFADVLPADRLMFRVDQLADFLLAIHFN